ncbi:DUF5988 family protein [Haloechinothrix halophila]|uniref:DUF5988 family protein n=1 Tax=Haloechinothrix halophila TaxID=1069073 RepID=UPI0003F54307|nr:DUF5988 family protein [Haloechinothrix halophila]
MTDITPDREQWQAAAAPLGAPAKDAEDAKGTEEVAGVAESRGTEALMPAELCGSPFAVPGVMVTRAQVADGTLKIPCANGYDHFEFDSYVTRNGTLIPVFAWTDRTRVAE